MEEKEKCRCKWANSVSMEYHDEEWCKQSHDDNYLFEMIVLESFQAGLSWNIVLKKREGLRNAFDGFDYKKISQYTDDDIERLLNDSNIIRSKSKINSTINNAKRFIEIQEEFGSFDKYIWSFTDGKTIRDISLIYEPKTNLSEIVCKDMRKRGMKYMGAITTYAFLLAIGIYNGHEEECYLCPENS